MMTTLIALLLMFMMPSHALGKEGLTVEGSWKFVPEKSTDIATWSYRVFRLEIAIRSDGITIVHNWMERARVALADTFFVRSGGGPTISVIHSAIWPENWYMGVLSEVGATRSVSGESLETGRTLHVVIDQPVRTSQGKTTVKTKREYRLSTDGATLTLTEQRSSRPLPVIHVFERVNTAKP